MGKRFSPFLTPEPDLLGLGAFQEASVSRVPLPISLEQIPWWTTIVSDFKDHERRVILIIQYDLGFKNERPLDIINRKGLS